MYNVNFMFQFHGPNQLTETDDDIRKTLMNNLTQRQLQLSLSEARLFQHGKVSSWF